ncbi:hypothetical protein WA158_000440 [Blastocystis sp. Blastoise]
MPARKTKTTKSKQTKKISKLNIQEDSEDEQIEIKNDHNESSKQTNKRKRTLNDTSKETKRQKKNKQVDESEIENKSSKTKLVKPTSPIKKGKSKSKRTLKETQELHNLIKDNINNERDNENDEDETEVDEQIESDIDHEENENDNENKEADLDEQKENNEDKNDDDKSEDSDNYSSNEGSEDSGDNDTDDDYQFVHASPKRRSLSPRKRLSATGDIISGPAIVKTSKKGKKVISEQDTITSLYEDIENSYKTGKYTKRTIIRKLNEEFSIDMGKCLNRLLGCILLAADVYLPINSQGQSDDSCSWKDADILSFSLLPHIDSLIATKTNYYSVYTSKSRSQFGRALSDISRTLPLQRGLTLVQDPFKNAFIPTVIALTKSHIRSVRLVSTHFILNISIALLEEGDNIQKEKDIKQKQLDNNRGKNASLKKELQELQKCQDILQEMAGDIYREVYISRVRDTAESIRDLTLSTLYEWIVIHPDIYLQEEYIKYLGWGFYDSYSINRYLCVYYTLQLVKNYPKDKIMKKFVTKYVNRFVYMTRDTDEHVIIMVLKLLTELIPYNIIEEDQSQLIYELTMDQNVDIRRNACLYMNKSLYKNIEDKDSYLYATISFLEAYITQDDTYSFVYYFCDAAFLTLRHLYDASCVPFITLLLHNPNRVTPSKLSIAAALLYYYLYLLKQPCPAGQNFTGAYVINKSRDYMPINNSVPEKECNGSRASLSREILGYFSELLSVYKTTDSVLLYILKLLEVMEISIPAGDTNNNIMEGLSDIFHSNPSEHVIEAVCVSISHVEDSIGGTKSCVLEGYTTIEEYLLKIKDMDTAWINSQVTSGLLKTYLMKLVCLYKYMDIYGYITADMETTLQHLLLSFPVNMEEENELYCHIYLYRYLFLSHLWQLSKDIFNINDSLIPTIRDEWKTIATNYTSDLYTSATSKSLLPAYIGAMVPAFLDYCVALSPSSPLPPTDSLFESLYILIHIYFMNCSDNYSRGNISEDADNDTNSRELNLYVRHQKFKIIMIPLSRFVRVYNNTTATSCLFHYFVSYGDECTQLCKYVLLSLKTLSASLYIHNIYTHIHTAFSYWMNGFQEDERDSDGYIYIKQCILVAKRMTSYIDESMKQEIIDYSKRGIEYGCSQAPSNFGFFDYIYILTNKLSFNDRSGLLTFLEQCTMGLSEDLQSIYNEYKDIYDHHKENQKQDIPNDWKALLEYRELLRNKKATKATLDDPLELPDEQ